MDEPEHASPSSPVDLRQLVAQLEEGEGPVHVRTVEFRAFTHEQDLVIVGRLVDGRPWADGWQGVVTVHDLELIVQVGADLRIAHAEAHMGTYPHAECPAIAPDFSDLVGLTVARGYTRAVQERFGGPRGCTHLEQIARSLGPVVIQAVTSVRAQQIHLGTSEDLLEGATDGSTSPWALGSCHIWAEDGPAVAKLRAGWRPGIGVYPAPPLATFLDPPVRR